MIVIIDCGSQLTQNIARRVRELGSMAHILPNTATYASIRDRTHPLLKDVPEDECGPLEGLILSGGPFSVHDDGAPKFERELLDQPDVPVLGICYGMQSISHMYGGKVSRAENREYGSCRVVIDRDAKHCALLSSVPTTVDEKTGDEAVSVWMSHGDVVDAVPDDFTVVARSHPSGHVAIAECVGPREREGRKPIYTLQFHPEVTHTDGGFRMIENFVIAVCSADTAVWSPTHVYDKVVRDTRAMVEGKVGIVAVSGGVDSTTLAVFLTRVAGAENVHPIYIDNGLMRLDETDKVKDIVSQLGLTNVKFVDASERFLAKLRGVNDPDERRKIIGHEFIAVFEEEARKIEGKIDYLAQGTLYPDVIESVPPPSGVASHKIKRHHNVGGLPDVMELGLVEPFRLLFKDEVRRIASEELGMPDAVVNRHPFPGPGLGIRLHGEITPERLARVRAADDIFIRYLKEEGIYNDISQAFAFGTGMMSTGVVGDAAAMDEVIGIRAVVTTDFMTADFYMFTQKQFTEIATRIANQVDGVSRVVYDITSKPPSTIEIA